MKSISTNHKITLGPTLIITLLMTFALVSPIALKGQTPPNAFQNITVNTAYDMITEGSFPNLIILDVRYQCEYDMGHLYDAVLIPYDELETRIGELEDLLIRVRNLNLSIDDYFICIILEIS